MTDFNLDDDEWGRQLSAPYEPSRSALLVRDGKVWGVVGEFKTNVTRALKLPTHTAGFEIHLELLSTPEHSYNPLSKYPAVWQDVTLKVNAAESFGKLRAIVDTAFGANAPAESHIALNDVGIYQSQDDPDHKNVTFRITVTPLNRTLTDTEVNTVVDAIAHEANQQIGAERV